MITLKVNGEEYRLEVDGAKPLLYVLREDLQLTGTKYSCGVGLCGTCRVEVDGQLITSCTTQVSEIEDNEITTVEGLRGAVAEAVEEAWLEKEVSQCGYCQPGQIVNANHLLKSNPQPSSEEINEAMVGLCRCGSYQRIRQAVLSAATKLSSGSTKGGE
jgi:isoquinoline 1-oxidoreductase subunit alpha